MSDELRDALRARSEGIDVPSGDLGGVVRGGRGLKVRRIAMATTATVVVVAIAAWGATSGVLFDSHEGGVADPAPSETETPSPTPEPTESDPVVVGQCERVPFRPTYLPEGWSYVLHEGHGGQQGIPPEQQSPQAYGHYRSFNGSPGAAGFISVFKQGAYYTLAPDAEPIQVLGNEGRIGPVEDGFSVEFEYEGCSYALTGFGQKQSELRRVAEELAPNDCKGNDIEPVTDVTAEGRLFGSIKAVNATSLELDEAEFLTGEAANEAAVEDGYIEEGDTVPNDYYVDDPNQRITWLPISRDVVVELETYAEDGNVGLAPRDYTDLVCIFEETVPIDRSHTQAWYWVTVTDGVVTRIEEQYVP